MSITNVITRITVDMAGDVKRFAVKAKQYDRATRVIVVSLLWDEVPYVLDSADTVRCNVHKPDGTIAIIEGDNIAVNGNTVTITLPGTALTAAGRAWADIEIETQDESQQVSCQCFEIDIAKSPVDDDSIISTNEFSAMKLATKAANDAAAAATAEIEATAAAGTAASQAAAAAQAATDAANQAAAAATASIQIDTTLTDNSKAAPAGMVGQIKEDLSDTKNLLLTQSDAVSSSTLTIGKYRSLKDHTQINDPACAFSGSLITSTRKGVTMTNTDYEFAVNCYSSTPVSHSTLIRGIGWCKANAVIVVPENAYVIVCQVKKINGSISESETDAIKSAFIFFVPTDKTLSIANKAADAKVTGDKIAESREIINAHSTQRSVSIDGVEVFSWYMTVADGKVTSSPPARMIYIPCVKNTRYRIDHARSGRFIVGCFNAPPVVGSVPTSYVIGTSADTSETTTFVTTESTTQYLGIYYFSNSYNLGYTADEALEALAVYSNAVDATLTKEGIPADAKATGNAIAEVRELAVDVGNYYSVSDDTTPVNTYDGVIDLYDVLATNHPDFVTKNTLTSGSLTNYEYVLTIGNYNTAGYRSRDAVIAKPKVLVTSGTHGYERTAVMSLYRFVKSICENAYQLNDIIDFPEFHIIPVVCPWGYTNNSRINENGVNINRNFDTSDWTQTSEGSDYSGAAPGDQDETQIVQHWLVAHDDAVIYIDWHNSNFVNELSCMLGLVDEISTKIKHNYLYGINRVIPYWQKRRNLGTANIYGYTGMSSTPGTAKTYGSEHDITSFTFETSWNVASSGKHSAFSIATGAEAFGNMLKGIRDILL